MSRWQQLKAKYADTLERFGTIAITTYLTLFVATLAGFWFAIRMGFQPEGVTAGAGTIGAAYVATKLTQPIRIGATILVTPIVAAVIARFQPRLPGPS